MTKPLVSIVVPCRDGERHLRAALASALAQTWVPIEVIYVDDGSRDGSREVARRLGERVQIVATSPRGVACARNLGFERSSGRFVHFLDADDVLPRGALAEKMALFDLYPEAGAIYSRAFVPNDPDFDETVALPRGYADLVRQGRLTRATGCAEVLGAPCPACTPVLYRREVLADSGGFDSSLPVLENVEFNLRLYLDGVRFVYVDTVGLVYRNDRRGSRQTDRETYLHRDLLVAVEGLVRTVASRGALAGEFEEGLFTMAFDAGRTAVAHGDGSLASAWFALAERIRPGGLPSRPLLRPLTRRLGAARARRIERRLARLAGKVGLRPRRPSGQPG